MRLIDADALYTMLVKKHSFGELSAKGAIRCVTEQPTVDALPVIRCKDCKWYYRGGATCMFWDGANGMCADDFCGKAERAEE